MPSFAYTAIDPAGLEHRGIREAATSTAATESLTRDGLFVLGVTAGSASSARARSAPWRRRTDLLEATRTLAALIPAGLPLARALAAASRGRAGATVDAIVDVQKRVEQGELLATALDAHPAMFPKHYVGLVRAGERSGDLAGAFVRLTAQLEREAQLRNRLLSASIYPLLLAAAGGVAMLVLLLVVLPHFAELLQGTHASLPATTTFVLGVSDILRRFWFILPMGSIAGVAVWVEVRRAAAARLAFARFVDTVPFVRAPLRDLRAARFARLAGTLLSGGAPLLVALDDTAASFDDPLAELAVARVRAAVRDGASLYRAVAADATFPPLLSQLIEVGEESGHLGEFLEKAAGMFEERVERTTQRLVTLAEPAMIVLFGALVGFVALSLLQAIYSVNAGSFR